MPVQSKSDMVTQPAAKEITYCRSSNSKAIRFRETLQGTLPPPATHFTNKIPSAKVVIVPGAVPPVYHTSFTAKDGDCMFRAIAIGLAPPKEAASIRRDAVRYIGTHTENFMAFIEVGSEGQMVAFKNYLSRMNKSGETGMTWS